MKMCTVFAVMSVLVLTMKEYADAADTDKWPQWKDGAHGTKWKHDCDFSDEDDIHSLIIDEGKCAKQCIDYPNCNAYSFNSKRGRCNLKNIPLDLDSFERGGSLCGFLPWKFDL